MSPESKFYADGAQRGAAAAPPPPGRRLLLLALGCLLACGMLTLEFVAAPASDAAARGAMATRDAVAPPVDAISATSAAGPPAEAPGPSARAAAPPTPAAPPPILSFDAAIDSTVRSVLRAAGRPSGGAATIVIDPLIDGVTGYQSKATQTIQERIAAIVKRDFAEYRVQRITSESLERQPRFLVGTFTPVDADLKPAGERESYWFCLVMGDLATGKIVAKAVARVRIQDADATPTAIFADSPVWTLDPSVQAYVENCQQSKVGDDINPQYLGGLLTAALVSEAGDAYDAGHYGEALGLYETARKSAAGDQLRVYNGLYLSLTKLKRSAQAEQAFRDLVDYGLRKQQLAVKILFRPGSVRFASGTKFGAAYDMWLAQIASQAAASNVCLKITGHTSPTGSVALNDNLSLLRAQYVQTRLEDSEPRLIKRMVAAGVGSRENLIGTGRDDASDMLDRRVELRPIPSCS